MGENFPRDKRDEEIERELLGAQEIWEKYKKSSLSEDSALHGRLGEELDVIKRWQEICLNASAGSVSRELERILGLLAIQDFVLEELGAQDRVEQILDNGLTEELRDRIEHSKYNFAIESMGKILSSE